jgi:hypothetical protein
MPTPIPEWDLPRRIIKYIGVNQIRGRTVIFRDLCRTIGIGRDRIEKILQDRQVTYRIVPEIEGQKHYYDAIVLEHVPPALAADAEISRPDLLKSYAEYDSDRRTERQIRQKRMNKKELENLRVRETWSRKGG